MSDLILQLQLADHHRELMTTLRQGQQGDVALLAQHNHLVDDYNQLLSDYNAQVAQAKKLKAWADERIAKLEERALDAESSAEHWRNKYSSLFKRTLPG